ncbi:glycosyltransferase family 4 protein [Sulfobacillus sp. hq2]|uniref:glycosyltransferase family 4 protein n=1 Tax=Sulfobacillus TaxID=28033 RepID=UPI00130500DD|nr:glycosyltransferase family 4 protein [Sulfobacillus sp. hq2]
MTVVFIDTIVDPKRPGRSGHSDIIWSLAKRLVLLDVKVVIVGPYSHQLFYHCNLTLITFQSISHPDQNGFTKINQVLRALKMLRRHSIHPDIVHTSDAFSAGVCSSRLHFPVIFTTSGNIKQRQASKFKLDFISALFYNLVSFLAVRNASMIVATSKNMAYWWTRTGARNENIQVIKLGTELVNEPNPRKVWSNTLNLLYVGRLEMENNPEHLINVIALLEKKRIDYSLTIVGDGSLRNDLERCLQAQIDNRRVQFKNTLQPTSLIAEYKKAHLLIITREAGAPPRTALEALAMGIPVLAFHGCGLEDYVINGANGYLYPEGSVSLMVEQIEWLTMNKSVYEVLSNNSRNVALVHMDWGPIAQQYLETYEFVLSRGDA